ncbi:MAG: phosphomethylpyrimidine synthase ThiC [Candidatus Omnitrophica bacterium]|jgi:phosphomethylpyrimidine synthase|nr:phosphomethylpyrimidine synthase ThiC [Candidatus Omnitrophota bacterium]
MFKKSFINHLAKKEKVHSNFLVKQLNNGKVIIPLNKNRKISKPCAIGEGLKVKINTNLGLSTNGSSIKIELKKMDCAVKNGADAIMDLSVNKAIKKMRRQLLSSCPLPLGTVPIYETAVSIEQKGKSMSDIKFKDIFDTLQQQAEEGVDFFTIHAGILKSALKLLSQKKRVGGIVSRGGAILARWMLTNKKENPFFENFDKVLQLAKKYNITLSLGDALRPGAIFDSTDTLQIFELRVLGDLVKRCWRKGVQVMVEGPGHIRLNEIAMNVALEKKLCHGAPFYVLGPLPTDIASGYDHITSAIGGTIAAFNGANFLCVVTPAEHLRHPNVDDIKEGTIASRIAAHCVNILKFKDELAIDNNLSLYRAHRNWEKIFSLTIDKVKAKKYRKNLDPSLDICTMCGKFCSLKIADSCDFLQ